MPVQDTMSQAGRCTADCRYSPSAFAREADFRAETLYVAGGLYGDLAALDTEPSAESRRAGRQVRVDAKTSIRDAARTPSSHDRVAGSASASWAVVNNGVAGMPNFGGTTFGVITRFSVHASPHCSLYGMGRDGVFIDALPVHCEQGRSLEDFLAELPPGSPAHGSHFHRLIDGRAFSFAVAVVEGRPSTMPACECAP